MDARRPDDDNVGWHPNTDGKFHSVLFPDEELQLVNDF